MRTLPLFEDAHVQEVLRELTREHRLDADLLKDLCNLERDSSGTGKAFGIDADIADALDRCLMRLGDQ